MNGIAGMAKLLGDTRLSPEQETYVSAIKTSASSLLALIEDLLDYSKIEAGRFEPEPQPMSPRDLADGVVELLAARAYEKGIGLACSVAPDMPKLISADPGRVRQVLLNLIGNAIKFTDSGGVAVSVSLQRGDRPMVRFSVSDTGEGISEADRDRIFEEFEQADSTPTRVHGGVGLGLAISRKLVQSMGGDIRVEAGGRRIDIYFYGASDRRHRNGRRCGTEPCRQLLFDSVAQHGRSGRRASDDRSQRRQGLCRRHGKGSLCAQHQFRRYTGRRRRRKPARQRTCSSAQAWRRVRAASS
jgi:signal transduction histidine kinase